MALESLFELTAMDPISLLAATVVLFGVAGGSVYIPARRASLVKPLVALRFE